jgi:hypothetical protein
MDGKDHLTEVQVLNSRSRLISLGKSLEIANTCLIDEPKQAIERGQNGEVTRRNQNVNRH